jgi:hypothetical protein
LTSPLGPFLLGSGAASSVIAYHTKIRHLALTIARVSDPDPNWIRIQEGKNDPQK